MATRTHQPKSTYTSQVPSSTFSSEMRDRQARGQDPYSEETTTGQGSGTGSGTLSGAAAAIDDKDDQGDDAGYTMHSVERLMTGRGLPRESFEEREKKDFAMAVLDNPELLLMHAQAQGDSVAGQKLRFLRMLCPIEQEKDRQVRIHGRGQRW